MKGVNASEVSGLVADTEREAIQRAAMSVKPNCPDCVCYVAIEAPRGAVLDVRKGGERGECHHNPPQIVATAQGIGAGFPQVMAGQWCAKFFPSPQAIKEAQKVLQQTAN